MPPTEDWFQIQIQIRFCKAASMGNVRAMRKLLARGAKKNGKDNKGDTAILLAAACGQTDAVRTLLKWQVAFDKPSRKAPPWHCDTPTAAAAWRGCADVVALFLEAGAEAFEPGRTGCSAWALAEGDPDVMKVLKAHRARCNWAKVRSPINMEKIKTLSI